MPVCLTAQAWSAWRICGSGLLAGGGEHLACAAYYLLGSG